jgi:hypothetical protein
MQPAKSFLDLPAHATLEEQIVAAAWNRHGELLSPLAEELGLPSGAVVAVLCVESGGKGFGLDGRLMIRFENQIFWQRWGCLTEANREAFRLHFRFHPEKKWTGHMYRVVSEVGTSKPGAGDWRTSHQNQTAEWESLETARTLEETEALCSTSMGCAQLMGFHFARVGYGTVQEMFRAFGQAEEGERHQISAMFRFIAGVQSEVENEKPARNVSPMLRALRQSDFVRFAKLYNGSGKAGEYGQKLARYRDIFLKMNG